MRLVFRIVAALACLSLSCVVRCTGQDGTVRGHVFRSDTLGLTYTFPDRFFPRVESEMLQRRDPSGREHVILAFWKAPERLGIPRMAFLHDTKIRPAGTSRDTMAARYLRAMNQEVQKWQGVKVSDSKQISPAGYTIWRLDYWHPADSGPPYNSAIVIPLKDRSILAIQINAPSQNELDSEVDSLRELRFDDRRRPE